MSGTGAQRGIGGGAHLLLYDGVCGLCSGLVRTVLAWDRRRLFRFAALQSDAGRRVLEEFGRDPSDLTTLYVVAKYGTPEARGFAKARGALFVAEALGWPFRALAALRVLPTGLLDSAYDLVARYRYAVFGRRETCLVPDPEVRGLFLDAAPSEERRTP
jgi:predicted DCC family thiol-disulfide oxidoreductase YuxK